MDKIINIVFHHVNDFLYTAFFFIQECTNGTKWTLTGSFGSICTLSEKKENGRNSPLT